MNTHDAETIAITACNACGAGLLETDKFCRRCGANQLRSQPLSDKTGATKICTHTERLETNLVPAAASQELYNSVSGPLVKAIVSGVLVSNTSRLSSQAAPSGIIKSSILALVLVPIWMIIVLLSPLDAYMAARTLSRAV